MGLQSGDYWVGRSGVFEEVMKELLLCASEMVKKNVVGVGDLRFFYGLCGGRERATK